MAPPTTELNAYGKRLLARMVADARKADAAEERLHRTVADCREAGIPWTFIGQALGVSRQAVTQRFSKPQTGRLV